MTTPQDKYQRAPDCISPDCANKDRGGACGKCTEMLPQDKGWEERLQVEVMEDYLMTAKIGYLDVDQIKHLEEMRNHWEKLKAFIRQELHSQKEEILASLPEEKGISSDDHELYQHQLAGFNTCLKEVRDNITKLR